MYLQFRRKDQNQRTWNQGEKNLQVQFRQNILDFQTQQQISNFSNKYPTLATNIQSQQQISNFSNKYQNLATNIQLKQQISKLSNTYPTLATNIQPQQQISNLSNKYSTLATNIQPQQHISNLRNRYRTSATNNLVFMFKDEYPLMYLCSKTNIQPQESNVFKYVKSSFTSSVPPGIYVSGILKSLCMYSLSRKV